MLRFAAVLLVFSLAVAAQAQSVQPPTAASAKSAAKKPVQRKPVGALQPAVTASGPCIGVFPLIGDRFAVNKIGLTVFGNEYKEIAVDNWGLDDLVVERVQAAVGPGISVRRIATAEGAFDGYKPGTGLFQNSRPRRRRNASVTSLLPGAPITISGISLSTASVSSTADARSSAAPHSMR
jgi:hypothetical protein